MVSQGGVSFEQQQLAPNRTSAFMSTSTDAWGTTIQGLGADAGVLRYQASMSRLPTTFTVTERQAAAFGDTARQAQTLARSEREALTSSQAATLSRAMALQSGFEQSTQRSGDTTLADSGSSATQIQRLNAVSRDVNRRLGLADDSTVGTAIVGSAMAGAKIPLTEIGASMSREGRQVESERLTSAYDFARRATQSAQIGQADSLVREFRQSDAYQWARQQRTSAADSFDSSWRETQDRQSSADIAYTRAQELARTAQFMAEWSSGAQTDFTNYAAQRLAERGLLKEADPIRLQRAVTDVAMAYARGGHTGSGFVSADSPFLPDRQASFAREGFDTPLTEQYRDAVATQMDDQGLRSIASTNNQLVALERSSMGVHTPAVQNDLESQRAKRQGEIEGRASAQSALNAAESNSLADSFKNSTRAERLQSEHGGNRARWDIETASRADLAIEVPAQTVEGRQPSTR
jgi:conjugal transfer mating pair stabilization protein TraG